jgi:acyl carrier protein
MEAVRDTIHRVLTEIAQQNGVEHPDLAGERSLVQDLGFASMDVAQLVATLEMELEVDPFAEGAAITEARTVGDFLRLYETALNQPGAAS